MVPQQDVDAPIERAPERPGRLRRREPALGAVDERRVFSDPQNTGQTRRGSSRFSEIRSRGQLWLCHCAPSSSQRAAVARNDGGELSHGGGSLRTQRSPGFLWRHGPRSSARRARDVRRPRPAPRARDRRGVVDVQLVLKFVAQVVWGADGDRAARQPEPQGLVVVQGARVGYARRQCLLDYARCRWTWR